MDSVACCAGREGFKAWAFGLVLVKPKRPKPRSLLESLSPNAQNLSTRQAETREVPVQAQVLAGQGGHHDHPGVPGRFVAGLPC